MRAAELIEEVGRIGGELSLKGDRLRYRLPVNVAPELIENLKVHKSELVKLLRQDAQPEDLVAFPPPEPVSKADLRDARDPVGRAAFELLRHGEYIDERGRIRRVQ